MVQIKKLLLIMAMILLSMPIYSQTEESFDWADVIEAIIQLESKGNPNAKNGNSVGVLQITPILVKECNRICKKQQNGLHYTLDDRRNVEKSKEMFILIQSEYNKKNSIEYAIKSWNGGVHCNLHGNKVNRYYRKVMKLLDNIQKQQSLGET